VVILVVMRIEYRGCRGVFENFEDDKRSDCFAWWWRWDTGALWGLLRWQEVCSMRSSRELVVWASIGYLAR
jgi:hypothetical protein